MKVYTRRWLLCRYLQAICCDCTTRISNWGGSFDSSGGYIKCNISRSLEDLAISIYFSVSNLFLHLFRFFPLYFQFRYISFLSFLCDPHLPPFDTCPFTISWLVSSYVLFSPQNLFFYAYNLAKLELE